VSEYMSIDLCYDVILI